MSEDSKFKRFGLKYTDFGGYKVLPENKKEEIKIAVASTKHHVDKYNIGQHDQDNSFMWCETIVDQFNYWRMQNPQCVPIGFCDEEFEDRGGFKFIAFVYENWFGNRYYVHVPEEWKQIEIGE